MVLLYIESIVIFYFVMQLTNAFCIWTKKKSLAQVLILIILICLLINCTVRLIIQYHFLLYTYKYYHKKRIVHFENIYSNISGQVTTYYTQDSQNLNISYYELFPIFNTYVAQS